jgi:hypothetical protein
MSEAQFKELMAVQLAQLHLLQSIEANIGFLAQQQVKSASHPNWNKTAELLDKARAAYK